MESLIAGSALGKAQFGRVQRPTPDQVELTSGFQAAAHQITVHPAPLAARSARDLLSQAEALQHPYCAAGKLISTGGKGSGVLVGPYHLLTAAHNILYNNDASRIKDEGHIFYPAYWRGARTDSGRPKLSSRLTGRYILAGPWKNSDPVKNEPKGFDFAICELEPSDRLGDHWGWLPVAWGPDSFYENRRWMSIGYPGSVAGGEEPSRYANLKVDDIDGDDHDTKEIEFEEPFGAGWSGGPLIGEYNGMWVVAGVCVGDEYEPFDGGQAVFGGWKKLGKVVEWAYCEFIDPSRAGSWTWLGGKFSSPPAVVSWAPNRLDIFALGNDRAMYQKTWNGCRWLPL